MRHSPVSQPCPWKSEVIFLAKIKERTWFHLIVQKPGLDHKNNDIFIKKTDIFLNLINLVLSRAISKKSS